MTEQWHKLDVLKKGAAFVASIWSNGDDGWVFVHLPHPTPPLSLPALPDGQCSGLLQCKIMGWVLQEEQSGCLHN